MERSLLLLFDTSNSSLRSGKGVTFMFCIICIDWKLNPISKANWQLLNIRYITFFQVERDWLLCFRIEKISAKLNISQLWISKTSFHIINQPLIDNSSGINDPNASSYLCFPIGFSVWYIRLLSSHQSHH